uniref:Beta-defensin n=1 Tax=Equus asinus TaxID=9793 RepID=A0A8C4PUX8_EQUAS
MKILALLLTIFLFLYRGPTVRSDLDAGRICGYGTARCQRKCKKEEFKTGICSNISPCCLKKWNANSLNPVRY